MKRVLVTGATTTTGRALVRQLLAKSSTERVLAVGFENVRESALRDGRLLHLRYDLSRERSVRSLIFGPAKDEGIDTIVHMATHRGVSSDPRIHALNVDAPRRVLHFAERVPSVERFVYRSFGGVYAISPHLPVRIDEDHPLRIGAGTPQYILDRVEADLAVCARMGMSRIRIAVLRCAECLAAGTGSQLWDYLRSDVCLKPIGFDPMVNVISDVDVGRALALAAESDAEGVFTIPGKDTLPLSRIIARFGRRAVPVPGPALRPLYAARSVLRGHDFRYDISLGRLHFGGVLDGRRAHEVLGYEPEHSVQWPLRFAEIDRRSRADNPRSLRGRAERWLERD